MGIGYGGIKKVPAKGRDFCVHDQVFVLGSAHIVCLGTFAALANFVLNLLALIESPETFHRDVAVMNEEVLSAVIGGYETIPLFGVEPLHCTFTHYCYSSDPQGSVCCFPRLATGAYPRGYKDPPLTLQLNKHQNVAKVNQYLMIL